MKALLLLDFTGKVFLQKEKILYWLLSAFFVSLFLPEMPVVNNIFIVAVVLHSFFFNTVAEKGRLLRARKDILCMIVFYLLLTLSAFLSTNKAEGMTLLVRRLPLIIFPLCIGLVYIREELKDRILLSYCFFTTVAAIVCLLFAFLQYKQSGDAEYLFSDNLTRAIGRESVYIGMVVNLALFIYVYLLQKQSFAIEYKGLVYLSILFLLGFHYLLASHIAMFTLYAGLLVFAVWLAAYRKRYILGGIMAAVLLAGGYLGLTMRQPPVPGEWNATESRIAVWQCGWELAKGHLLTGVPLGDKQDLLVEMYRQHQLTLALETRRNMHNTFLDVLTSTGVIGLAVFLLAYLVFPLAASYKDKDGLGTFIILSFAVAMIPETWLDRSVGCIMTGFFFSLAAAWRR